MLPSSLESTSNLGNQNMSLIRLDQTASIQLAHPVVISVNSEVESRDNNTTKSNSYKRSLDIDAENLAISSLDSPRNFLSSYENENEENEGRNTLTNLEEITNLEMCMRTNLTDTIIKKIEYSLHYTDGFYEYRWVQLPFVHPFLDINPLDNIRNRTLTRIETKLLGIIQSDDWVHVSFSPMEPNVLIFKRPINELNNYNKDSNKEEPQTSETLASVKHNYISDSPKNSLSFDFKEFSLEHLINLYPENQNLENSQHVDIFSSATDSEISAVEDILDDIVNYHKCNIPRWCVRNVLVRIFDTHLKDLGEGFIVNVITNKNKQVQKQSKVLIHILSGPDCDSEKEYDIDMIAPLHPGESKIRKFFEKVLVFYRHKKSHEIAIMKAVDFDKEQVLLEVDRCPLVVPLNTVHVLYE